MKRIDIISFKKGVNCSKKWSVKGKWLKKEVHRDKEVDCVVRGEVNEMDVRYMNKEGSG